MSLYHIKSKYLQLDHKLCFVVYTKIYIKKTSKRIYKKFLLCDKTRVKDFCIC